MAHPVSTLRIIAGEWRGRKLPFAAVTGVRPTPDRIRETLFNWLQAYVPGARCLDCFAGSGALGFEAASRGAASVTMIDQDIRVIQQIQQNINTLNATQITPLWGETPGVLNECAGPFDVLFLDPPFREDILESLCQQFENSGLLADNAHIYLEYSAQKSAPTLPDNWELIRSKKSGQVSYGLALRSAKT